MIKNIFQHRFDNGLQLKYIHKTNTEIIDIQVWFQIGSAYENRHELGICHMIEHMIFKGSKEIQLGEIDNIIYQMNGNTNAFTTKEFTAYTFSIPRQFFKDAMRIINLVFDQPRFDTNDLEIEKQVVIQEILSYQDDPFSVLLDNAFLASKCKYNYKTPILGTVQTVSSFTSEQLQSFYLKNYIASKTTFFITGNISKKILLESLKTNYFGKLPFLENNDTVLSISSPIQKEKNKIHYAYSSSENNHFLITYVFNSPSYHFFCVYKALDILLGAEKDSLLYKKLCLELKLTSSIKTLFYTFSKETFFSIYFVPISLSNVPIIIQNIYDIIEALKTTYLETVIIEKLQNILYFDYSMTKTEQSDDFIFDKIPYIIKEKRNYLKFYLPQDPEVFKKQIISAAKKLVHKKLSINAVINNKYNPFFEKKNTIQVQDNNISESFSENDFNNIEIENKIKKISANESFNKVLQLASERKHQQKNIKERFGLRKRALSPFCPLPTHTSSKLENDMTLIFINDFDSTDELMNLSFSLDIKHYYEDTEYQGGLGFLFDLMYYGTKSHPGSSFIDYIEQFGIYFSFSIGEISIRCLKKYWQEAISALIEYLTEPELSEQFFKIVKTQILESIYNFNDDQMLVATQQNKNIMYHKHPFSQNPGGTLESITKITHAYIQKLYTEFVFSNNAICVCNGNLDENEKKIIMQMLLKIQKKSDHTPYTLPAVNNFPAHLINYTHINKQQVAISVLAYSAKQFSKDYYMLILAEQVLCGTLVNSMYSLIFSLRELFGYYYYINGSLTYNCTKEPGLIMIQALTSKEYYQESISLIKKLLLHFHKFINEYDVYIAKQALCFAIANKNEFRSTQNASLINAYRYQATNKDLLERYNIILNITKNDIIECIKNFLQEEKLYVSIVKKL